MAQPYPSEEPAVAGSSTGGLVGGGGGGGGFLPFYHVPQQSRREKLRFPPCTDVIDPSLFMAMAPPSSNPNPNINPQLDVELQYPHLFPQQQRHVSLSLVRGPSEPFTGYAAVLKASRFIRPAQQLLEEICDVGLTLQPCTDASLGDPHTLAASTSDAHGETRRTKTRLISMLDEVCRRYKQYYQQILDVVASFESVAGLKNASPYTSLALNSMNRHFQSLKNAISDQLYFTERAPGKECHSNHELPGFGILNGGLCYPGTSARAPGTVLQPNVWRPQRGLPERAVAVLKAWLFEHFLHPYPSDADKHMLARQTGLSRNQVSNWFINARVRLWKPLVEEIHALEMRQGRKAPDQQAENNRGSTAQANAPSTSNNHHPAEQPSQSNTPKRYRNDMAEMSNHIEEQMSFSFNEFSDGRVAAGAPMPNTGNGGVSLTLGLHQNDGVCLTETLPFTVARRFGLEDTNTPYAVGGFELQDRHFGKDIDGQLLRDFVG